MIQRGACQCADTQSRGQPWFQDLGERTVHIPPFQRIVSINMSALFKWCMDLGGNNDISSALSLQGPFSPFPWSRTPPLFGFNCAYSSHGGNKRHVWCSSFSDMWLRAEQWLQPIKLQQNKERNKGACARNSKCTSKPPSLPCRTDPSTGRKGDGEWKKTDWDEKNKGSSWGRGERIDGEWNRDMAV